MDAGTIIKTFKVKQGSNELKLDNIYPVKTLKGVKTKHVRYYVDAIETTKKNGPTNANRILVECKEAGNLDIVLGEGYLAVKDEEWTSRFQYRNRWCGGDGIFSFNLTNGNDAFDQDEDATQLFVFGDTLVGRVDEADKHRFEPIAMPNNSFAYLDKDEHKPKFHVNITENGSVEAFFAIDDRYNKNGTLASHLITYDQPSNLQGWLSGYDCDRPRVMFDLHKNKHVTHFSISNYMYEDQSETAVRGIKKFTCRVSDDKKKWDDVGTFELTKAKTVDDPETIEINHSFRYLEIRPLSFKNEGNHDDADEGLFGLNKVRFYDGDKQYLDVWAEADSTLLTSSADRWIWLQDGVVCDDSLTFFPFVVEQDLTQPEGLQFKVSGINAITVPIEDERILPMKASQKRTPFFFFDDEKEYNFGGALMPNTKTAGAPRPDGFVYVYGYTSEKGFRRMIAGRVKKDDLLSFDDWRFYDGEDWVVDPKQAKPLLDHISCEFSVSPVKEGKHKGKYLAVFTYDTDTPYIAYALGESPVGPFEDPNIIYKAPEPTIHGGQCYSYNAKAHPQVSSSNNVLVSYNTNTYSFEQNMANHEIYNPRFIRLQIIGG